MKTTLHTILFALIALSTSFAAPTAKVVSKYDENKRAQLIEWIEQLRVKAADADAKAVQASEALAVSDSQLAAAKENLATLQGDIVKLTQWGVDQQKLYLKAQAALDEVLKKYHFIKFWVSLGFALVSCFLVGLIIFRYAAPALNTIPGAILAFGVPAAVFAAVFGGIQLLL